MTIEQRVAKLEKQNRWMKRGGGLALAAVACVVLMGQGKAEPLPDLIGKSLTLKSERGQEWLTAKRSGLGFTLSVRPGGKGNPGVALLANEKSAGLVIWRGKHAGAVLSGGALTLHDAKGEVIWQAPPK